MIRFLDKPMGIALFAGLIFSGSAFAAQTHEILLKNNALNIVGQGGVEFPSGRTPGPLVPSQIFPVNSTIANPIPGVISFSLTTSDPANPLRGLVTDVNFEKPYNPGATPQSTNRGGTVMGLTGSLLGTAVVPQGPSTQTITVRATFTTSIGSSAAQRSYSISQTNPAGQNVGRPFLTAPFHIQNVNNIPEPGSLALLGIGIAGLWWTTARHRQVQLMG